MRLMDGEKLTPPPKPRFLPFFTKRAAFENDKSNLIEERNNYLEEWREISDYIQLRRGRFLAGKGKNARARSKKVLNEKGTFASRTCGAGMLAGVSSPSMPWLKLKTNDKDLNEFTPVKQWLDIAERYLYEVFASSNYYHVKQSAYRDMADFGQGPVLIDEDFDNVINCYCSPPGEYTLSVDHRGVVDTMFRDMVMTTQQVFEKFYGRGNIPREIWEAYNRGDYRRQWQIVGLDQPNHRQIKGLPGALGAPFIKVFYCIDCTDSDSNAILDVKPTYENPISSPRWEVQPNDIYGDGPGSLILSTVKSLQVLERRKGQMVDKMATPPVQVPGEMQKSKGLISHAPGGATYYPAQTIGGGSGGRPIGPLYEVSGPQLQAVMMEMQVLEGRVDVGYFVDLFMATLNSNRRQITAREIEEKHEEKLIALGPVLERTHYEGLNNDVKRAFGILQRHRVLPPPPPEMRDRRLEVEYTSLLAVAQKAVSAGPIERFAGFLGNLSAVNPEILDKWDMDQTVDEYGDAVGVPAALVRSDEQVEEMRASRAQQQQAAASMETAKLGADTAAVLSKADTGRDSNLLADLLGNGGQLM